MPFIKQIVTQHNPTNDAAKIKRKFRTAKRFGEKFWKGEVLSHRGQFATASESTRADTGHAGTKISRLDGEPVAKDLYIHKKCENLAYLAFTTEYQRLKFKKLAQNLAQILLKSCSISNVLTFITYYQILYRYLVKALPSFGNAFTKALRRRYQASAAALPKHGEVVDNGDSRTEPALSGTSTTLRHMPNNVISHHHTACRRGG